MKPHLATLVLLSQLGGCISFGVVGLERRGPDALDSVNVAIVGPTSTTRACAAPLRLDDPASHLIIDERCRSH